MEYLKSRVSGSQDWIHFNRNPVSKISQHKKKEFFVCYTSVDWDAALHFPSSIFSSQFEFINLLVSIFKKFNFYDLIIRIHPAEVTGFHPAKKSLNKYLNTLDLPENIKIIRPEAKLSSYEIAKGCLASIVYNTKLSIELAAFGIPVIVAGDAWIRGKGFSYDVNSSKDLEKYILLGKKLRITDKQISLAIHYAYYFFFQRCIDTNEIESIGPKFHIDVNQKKLVNNYINNSGISFISECILMHKDVIRED